MILSDIWQRKCSHLSQKIVAKKPASNVTIYRLARPDLFKKTNFNQKQVKKREEIV